jgi:hypothetical protein
MVDVFRIVVFTISVGARDRSRDDLLDPFLGSDTTAVAAIIGGRWFLGGDIGPGCVERTRRRLV